MKKSTQYTIVGVVSLVSSLVVPVIILAEWALFREPWIPNVTDPFAIVENLKDVADRFIFGSMQYMGGP